MVKKIKIDPVIKWSGSKRSQAEKIISYIPGFHTYYEPFVGGGSILYALSPKHGIGGDAYKPLIDLWNIIKQNPEYLYDTYNRDWKRLQDEGHLVFYEIRDRFNKLQAPEDLLFLTRTCVNGMIRFNNNGEFNNSLHHTRPGINPETLKNILFDWSENITNINFINGDYRETTKSACNEDFIYLDPPYFNTKSRYAESIVYSEFLDYLDDLNVRGIKYALSFDGTRGDNDFTVDLPKHLYERHIMLPSGNASFRKVIDKTNEQVFESLYLNF